MLNQSDVKKYLNDLHREYLNAKNTGAATPELSYRTHLHNFFITISEKLKSGRVGIIHEPSSTGKGRPDFRFHDKVNFGVYGYVEVKPFDNQVINQSEYAEQVEKYLQLGSNVILTDGLEFILYVNEDNEVKTLSATLVNSKEEFLKNGYTDENIGNLDDFFIIFNKFLQHSYPTKMNKKTLIKLLARRATLIREDVEMLLLRNHKGTNNEKVADNLRSILNIFKEQLDETLDEETFADVVGQLLIFSLLVAYSELIEMNNKVSDETLKDYFLNYKMQDYRPIRALINILKDINEEMGPIKSGWTDAALLLSYVKVDKEILGNYHDMYEEFHYQYNPDEKMDFGAYATPMELAKYVVRFCDFLVKEELSRDIFWENIKIVDPSCGTGTFLEALVNFALENKREINSEISGIEILPVPYTLAQMRLNRIANLDKVRKPKIYLGNSLSNSVVSNKLIVKSIEHDENESIKLLNEEFNKLQEATMPPIVAIIGNPPSSDSGFNMGENFSEIENALEDFRPPVEERGARQNIQKQLQNDFVKFIKWACLKIDEVGGGIISFIVPSSALRDRSYVYMRNYLLNNFDSIYVLEFDNDLRMDRSHSQNIFNTQQGRALITLLKKPTGALEPKAASATVRHKSITGMTKKEKFDWFAQIENPLNIYDEIQPYGWLKAFIPIKVEKEKVTTYEDYISIEDIFVNHVSGVKTGCTALVTHTEKEILERKLQEYQLEKISDQELFNKYFKGQTRIGEFWKGWKRAYVARELSKEFRKEKIIRYDFRPFMKSYIFYSKEVMKQASADGGRARPELEKVFIENDYKDNIALAVAKAPSLISKDLDQFVCVIEDLPDNDLASRNNSYIFPIFFPAKEDVKLQKNIRPIILEHLKEFYDEETKENYTHIVNDLISYIYAVLSSNTYRETFKEIIYHGLLKGMIRVPITKQKDLFHLLVKQGRKLANIQLMKEKIDINKSKIVVEGEVNIVVEKFKVRPDEKSIILLGANKGEKIIIKEVPEEVFSFRMKGYDILNMWLKYKTFPYLNRKFNDKDINDCKFFIENLRYYINEIPKLDPLVKELLDSEQLKLK